MYVSVKNYTLTRFSIKAVVKDSFFQPHGPLSCSFGLFISVPVAVKRPQKPKRLKTQLRRTSTVSQTNTQCLLHSQKPL